MLGFTAEEMVEVAVERKNNAENAKKKVGFLLTLHSYFLLLNARDPLLFIELKKGHLVFIRDQFWLLIQSRRISIVGLKSSSRAVKIWLLKADRVSLYGVT